MLQGSESRTLSELAITGVAFQQRVFDMNGDARTFRHFVRRQNASANRDAVRRIRDLAITKEKSREDHIASIASLLGSWIGSLISVPLVREPHTMCECYGHVIKEFRSYPPSCGDCGAPVKGLDDLRKATPRR